MAALVQSGAGDVNTAAAGSANTLILQRPANAVNGNYLLAYLYFRAAGGTITTPAGWAQVGPSPASGATFGLFYKKITDLGSEPANYQFSSSGSNSRAVGILARVTGADPNAFADGAGVISGFNGSSSVVIPSVTAGGNGKQLVAVAVNNNTTTGVPSLFTAPAGMSTVAQASADNNTSATATAWMGQETLSDTSVSGTRTVTIAPPAGTSAGFLITLNGSNTPPTVAPIPAQVKAAGDTATVTAVPADVDGVIAAHTWTVDKYPSGSAAPTLTAQDTATVQVSALSPGTTRLKYVATDSGGALSTPVYADLIVPQVSGGAARPTVLLSNGGNFTPGPDAMDLVHGLSDPGLHIVGPPAPSNAEITVEMEAPAVGQHTVSFYADWLENDGVTPASDGEGTFTAQVFQNGTPISEVKSAVVAAGAPVHLVFTMLAAEDALINADTANIEIQLKVSQTS